MLALEILPHDEKAAEIVKKFVNGRLVGMMEDIIIEEATLEDEISRELPIDDVVDFDGLMDSSAFAEEMALWNLPENFPADLVNREFFGLYRLLKDEEELTPNRTMQYILYQMINGEIEQIEDLKSDGVSYVLQIPEMNRSMVIAALEKEDVEDVSVEELIAYYEDLRMYDMICFADTDFLLFDDFDKDSCEFNIEAWDVE